MCQNNISFSSSHFYFSENDENNINKLLYLPKEPWSSSKALTMPILRLWLLREYLQSCWWKPGKHCSEIFTSETAALSWPEAKKNKHRRTQRSILELTEERAFSQKQSSHFPRHVWTYAAFHKSFNVTQKMCSFMCSTWWSPWFFTFRCREMAQWHCTVGCVGWRKQHDSKRTWLMPGGGLHLECIHLKVKHTLSIQALCLATLVKSLQPDLIFSLFLIFFSSCTVQYLCTSAGMRLQIETAPSWSEYDDQS